MLAKNDVSFLESFSSFHQFLLNLDALSFAFCSEIHLTDLHLHSCDISDFETDIMYSGNTFPRSGTYSPNNNRPTSPYPLSSSRSQTAVGDALGFNTTPFDGESFPCKEVDANHQLSSFTDSSYSHRRSPTSRNAISTPTSPVTQMIRGSLFNDLPPYLYSRYTDSQDYLSRTSNPYTTRSSLASSSRPLSPTSSSSHLSPTFTPSTPSYTSREWTRPSSPPPSFPSYSRNSPVLREYDSLPTTPYYSRTSSPLPTRSESPRPTTLSYATTTLLTDRPTSPSARIAYIPQRTYHQVVSDPDEGVKLTFPSTKTLVKETQDIAYGLDKQNNQTKRFIHDVDEQLKDLEHPRKSPAENHVFQTKPFKRYVDHDDDVTPKVSPRGSVHYTGNDVRKSVIEIPIKSEEQLLSEVRKSMERLEDRGVDQVSTTRRRSTAVAKQSQSDVYGSLPSKRYDSGLEFEGTVSSYELRKRNQGTKKVSLLILDNVVLVLTPVFLQEGSLLDKVKEYLPMIIGAIFAILILSVVINDITRHKKPHVAKTTVTTGTTVKKVNEAIKAVKVEVPIKPLKPNIEIPIKTVELKTEVPTKPVSKVELPTKTVKSKVELPAKVMESIPPKVKDTPKIPKPCCQPKMNKTTSITNKTLSKNASSTIHTPANKISKVVDLARNQTVKSLSKTKAASNVTTKGTSLKPLTAAKNVTQPIVDKVKKVVNETVKVMEKELQKELRKELRKGVKK